MRSCSMIQNKPWGMLALTIAFLLGGCGGSGITGGFLGGAYVTYAAADPNPIPTPAAGAPITFTVEFRAKKGGMEGQEVNLRVPLPDGRKWPIVAASCETICDGQLRRFTCTSSIVPSDPTKRELACISPDGTTDSHGYLITPASVSVGTSTWTLSVEEFNQKLDFTQDHIDFSVEVK